MNPSATAGRVSFDRTGPTPPGPFNLDIGTTENLVVNANGGNDRIIGSKGLAELIDSTFNGGDGKDRIKGTDGKDVLSGGKGSDLIRSATRRPTRSSCNGGFDIAFVDRRDTRPRLRDRAGRPAPGQALGQVGQRERQRGGS